jgi:hypothetical protein
MIVTTIRHAILKRREESAEKRASEQHPWSPTPTGGGYHSSLLQHKNVPAIVSQTQSEADQNSAPVESSDMTVGRSCDSSIPKSTLAADIPEEIPLALPPFLIGHSVHLSGPQRVNTALSCTTYAEDSASSVDSDWHCSSADSQPNSQTAYSERLTSNTIGDDSEPSCHSQISLGPRYASHFRDQSRELVESIPRSAPEEIRPATLNASVKDGQVMQSVLKGIQDRSDGGATICARTIITVQDLDLKTQAAILDLLGQKRHRVSIALD